VDEARTGPVSGVGLGLSIAMRSVRLHNGTIEAVNAQPGLLIRIQLPQALNGRPVYKS
jgi:two-component system sensor histidine kinase CpxA